ncbi:hypothetical protein BCS96_18275 [Vibrio breoganii]|uniref:hypothetical protein n=2 Tax=Vibrio breoganii TaxID=553239 RepID=UPI00030257B5|nr:hypothetical protein [Vibrio breoganii]OED97945.1 hypothetical protein A1QG_10335 [Vibrio breoganii ZF-29]PMG91325.1 hypothetical protein BCU80_12905 [Vibrio breoganii]PML36320.1 hypothetical protein BCT77_17060 [Vibrio breoganii]PMM87463.1 hypothetical protein BCT45_04670 [Vibrio breoganii]PMO29645.1 hypothetical protein BCT12_07330 [Vibrio breoganii]
MEILGFILVVALLLMFIMNKGKGEKDTSGKIEETGESVSLLEEKMREKVSCMLSDGLPKEHSDIRLTRGEELLASTAIEMYKYKNTGRGGYVGATYRIPTGVKGLNFKVGGGRVAAEKDWVHDGSGNAFITTKAIVIHDGTKAKRLTWGGISDIEVGLDYFHIVPNRGAVIRCVCDFVDGLDFIALLQLESQYQNILSEIKDGKMSDGMKNELITLGVIQNEHDNTASL